MDTALINVRGWLEGHTADIELVRESIEEDAVRNWYNFGWRFPHPQSTGHWYAFYGLHFGVEDLDWFMNRLGHLALLTTTEKPRLTGLFIISRVAASAKQVLVRSGSVYVSDIDPDHLPEFG